MIHVHKTYPSQIAALNDINLEISPGQFTFIAGPSGSGKTTLLHILFCSERPTSGQMIVNGIDITQKGFKKIHQFRRTIGMVFQDFKLLRDRTVWENIAFALEVDRPSKKRNPDKGIGDAEMGRPPWQRTRFGSHPLRRRKTAGGHRPGRLNNPTLILADEPTGNLDDQMAIDVMKLFMALHRQGTTVLFATQNKDLIQRYPYPVIQILKGKRIDDELGMEVKADS